MTKQINTNIKVKVYHNGKMIIVNTDNGKLCVSYDKPVVYQDYNAGKIFLNKEYYKYSTTTSRHVQQFLGINYEGLIEGIRNCKYEVVTFEE